MTLVYSVTKAQLNPRVDFYILSSKLPELSVSKMLDLLAVDSLIWKARKAISIVNMNSFKPLSEYPVTPDNVSHFEMILCACVFYYPHPVPSTCHFQNPFL